MGGKSWQGIPHFGTFWLNIDYFLDNATSFKK
jgi:hypothetical protein